LAATAFYSNDFEDTTDPLSEWSASSADTTPGTTQHPADRFLGQFSNDTVVLTLTDLPSHESISTTFDLYVIRTWDGNLGVPIGGEEWELSFWNTNTNSWDVLKHGGKNLHTGFSNNILDQAPWQAYPDPFPGGNNPARTGTLENDTLGFTYPSPGNPIIDSVYRIATDAIAHNSSTLQLQFKASGLQTDKIDPSTWGESWGLDNVSVTPEPATLALLAVGIGGLVLRRRRG
jgi:hypothetical protein